MRSALLIFFILVFLFPCFSQSISDAALLDRLKSFWETNDTSVIEPTFRKFTFQNKQVVFFGTRHDIKDTSDSMFIQIENEINSLNPTLILTEGCGALLDNKIETTKTFGDVGFCNYSGYERGVRVKSWDISYNDWYYALRKDFSENELYTLMVIAQLTLRADSSGGFSDLISWFEAKGWPLRPEQKNIEFFLKQYKRYIDIPFEKTSENNLHFPYLGNTAPYKKFYSAYQPFRDMHLIKALKEGLKHNDRIFIQAGAMHLLSLEKIIPVILKETKAVNPLENEADNHATRFLPDTNFSKFTSIEKIKNGRKQIVLFGSTYNADSGDPQFTRAKKEIAAAKPDLILTEGFAPLYTSEKQTISQSGIVGLCRFMGISKGIRTNSWEPSWDEVYYTLNKKYKPKDIYFSLLCWSILRSSNSKDANSIEEVALKTFTAFQIFGYPLIVKEDELDFFEAIAKYLGQPVFGTFGSPVADANNPDGAEIELKTDGSYKFGCTKPGTYKYNIPLCPFNGIGDSIKVPLELIAPPSFYIEISGSLSHPANYLPVEDVKEILRKCINHNIINDLHSIRAAHLLKQIAEYKTHYNKIFIQADKGYTNFIKAGLKNGRDSL